MTTIGGDGGLEVDLMGLGARIRAIRVPVPGGGRRDVVLGLPSDADYRSFPGYVGATVGRYANRIAGASFELDGVTHRLMPVDRGHALHAGPDGFDTRTWTVVEQGPRHAEMTLVSPHGDQGFPGTVTVRARFEVEGLSLQTTYTAVTDAPTHVNLSSHAYYDLDGTGPADLALTVHADAYLPTDATGIPTGEAARVAGTPYDLRSPTRLGDAPALDHCFVLRRVGMRTAAVLEGRDLRMELATDQPGLQVYLGNDRLPGVALEPQHFPDSPHHPEWPSTVLRPGETYRWVQTVTFSSLG